MHFIPPEASDGRRAVLCSWSGSMLKDEEWSRLRCHVGLPAQRHNVTFLKTWVFRDVTLWEPQISRVDTHINTSDLLEITNKQLELVIQVLYAVR